MRRDSTQARTPVVSARRNDPFIDLSFMDQFLENMALKEIDEKGLI